MQTIFEEFHQIDNAPEDSSKGLGLGLSIVQRLGHLLGHGVRVRSLPGKGSVFTIDLPRQTMLPVDGPPGHDRRDHDRRHEERDHDKDWRHNDQRHDARGQMRRPGWARDRGDVYRWQRGERMGYNDWNRAERIDYRRHHLRKPPRGYEWRRSNDPVSYTHLDVYKRQGQGLAGLSSAR